MRSLTKRQKDIALLVLSVIFFILLVSYSWFQLFAPAKEENERVITSLADQREVLFELQRQVASKPMEQSNSSRPLQRKVPVLPLEDLLLIQLEKAEVKSSALINNVTFTQAEPTDVSMETTEQAEPATEDPALALERLTVEVELTASTYEQMDRFIREVEASERVFVVQSIELDTPEEIREASDEKELLELTVSFEAFYRPDLKELLPELPKLDAPAPAGKEDPTIRAGENE